MFLQYYGMREHPFGVTPNPHSLYLSATHREALASLVYGIEAGRGFLALIAPPGMGKTTLLFQVLELLGSSARSVFLFHTQCDSLEFFHYLLADMGIESQGHGLAKMHDQLNQVLLAEAHAGRRFVLVIDEAQNLDESVLETVRLLSDFETPRSKLMQIILSGQPQLAKKLARPGLAQLRQRISLFVRLEPFSLAETRAYVDHRLKLAGFAGPPLFTDDALEMIWARGEGVPRNINNLCFNALSLGFALEKKKIDSAIVREVLADLDVNALTEEAAPATRDAQPALQQQAASPSYRSMRPAGRPRSALWVGALASATFVVASLLVFSWGRAKSGEHLFQPQTANTPDSAQPPMPTPSAPKTGPSSGANAELHTAEVTTQRGASRLDQTSDVSVRPATGTPAEESGRATRPAPSPSLSVRGAAPRRTNVVHNRSSIQRSKATIAQNVTKQPLLARATPSQVRMEPRSSLRPQRAAGLAAAGSRDASATVAAPGDLQAYRQAVQQSPGDPAAHHNLAHALQGEGDLDRAVAEYREALRLAPTRAESHVGLGGVLFEKRDFDGALAEFRTAVRLKPDDPKAHYDAGLVLYSKGDPTSLDTAVAEYRQAIRLRPNDADAHYALGIALFQKGDVDAAISEYRESLRMAPDRALVHEQLGRALLQKGERAAAAEELKMASGSQ